MSLGLFSSASPDSRRRSPLLLCASLLSALAGCSALLISCHTERLRQHRPARHHRITVLSLLSLVLAALLCSRLFTSSSLLAVCSPLLFSPVLFSLACCVCPAPLHGCIQEQADGRHLTTRRCRRPPLLPPVRLQPLPPSVPSLLPTRSPCTTGATGCRLPRGARE